MTATRALSERGDELGRVLYERMALIRCEFREKRLETWEEVSEMEREQCCDVAIAVALAAIRMETVTA